MATKPVSKSLSSSSLPNLDTQQPHGAAAADIVAAGSISSIATAAAAKMDLKDRKVTPGSIPSTPDRELREILFSTHNADVQTVTQETTDDDIRKFVQENPIIASFTLARDTYLEAGGVLPRSGGITPLICAPADKERRALEVLTQTLLQLNHIGSPDDPKIYEIGKYIKQLENLLGRGLVKEVKA